MISSKRVKLWSKDNRATSTDPRADVSLLSFPIATVPAWHQAADLAGKFSHHCHLPSHTGKLRPEEALSLACSHTARLQHNPLSIASLPHGL